MIISGTFNLSTDENWRYVNTNELRLECDTSTGAVIINLPLISELIGSVNPKFPKIYIVDISGNASVNNITVNPKGTDTIIGESPLIIDVDGGGVCITPAVSGEWIEYGDVEPDPGLTEYDSGWKALPAYSALLGYGFAANGVYPEIRCVNRQVFIRAFMVLPLAVGGVLQNNATLYPNVASNELYTGTDGGYTIGATGFIRSQQPIVPTDLFPAKSVIQTPGISFIKRTAYLSDGITKYNMLAPILNSVSIGTDGLLRFFLLKYIETDNLAASFPYSDLRRITSNFQAGDGVIDYTNYKNAYTGGVLQANTVELGGGITHAFSFNPEDMDNYGGFAIAFETSWLVAETTSLATIKAAFDSIP